MKLLIESIGYGLEQKKALTNGQSFIAMLKKIYSFRSAFTGLAVAAFIT
jgi:hypothetical protein